MRTSLIILFILLIVSVVFALQNPGLIELQFGPWAGQTSTAVVILAALAAGLAIGVLAMVPSRMRRNKEIRKLNRSIKDLTAPPTDEQLVEAREKAPSSVEDASSTHES